jgi:eukaryotic-like serine/threonine-protein kinase
MWIMPMALAGLVAVLGWWGNGRLRETVQEEVKSDLAATLNANVTALEIWTTNQVKLGTALAGEPELRALALEVLQPEKLDAQNRPALWQAASKELNEHLRARLTGLGYEIAHLIDTNFFIVATSTGGSPRLGFSISESHVAKFAQLFATGKPVIITPFRPRFLAWRNPWQFNRPAGQAALSETLDVSNEVRRAEGATGADPLRRPPSHTLMQVAVPVRDEHGIVRGALALVIDPDQEFTRILSVARAGKSGETYVFDQHGVMLSRSRFESQLRALGLMENGPGANSAAGFRMADPGPISKQRRLAALPGTNSGPLIQIVANAVAGGFGVDVKPSRDYRGVPVVGAWRWLPQHSFGVVTQIDADEAFKPLGVLNLLFAMVFLLLALCATGLFLASYMGALWRKRLNAAELRLQQLGQYTLGEKIGEGAMGTVYRAQHALMRRETAVKLLLPERADPLSIQRFEREVRLSSQLTHPNTIQVYDYGHTPEGVFYYAMELLRGLNLHELVDQFGPQLEARVVYILAQVCDALAEAHALGLVHRDIKPGNIFLCDRGGVPDWVKVLDFGLVRAFRNGTSSRPPEVGAQAEGTPLFMPPEAFGNSGNADPRSDIYSLGALGYYLLTAQHVFDGDSDRELFQKHQSQAPPRPAPRTANPVSAEMEETILRCLEKEPNLRPQSVAELHQLLLTSPVANDWRPEDRAAWWARFRAGKVQERAPAEAVVEPGTVRIDLAGERR